MKTSRFIVSFFAAEDKQPNRVSWRKKGTKVRYHKLTKASLRRLAKVASRMVDDDKAMCYPAEGMAGWHLMESW